MNFVLRGKLASAHPYSLDKTLTVVGAGAEANATGKAIAEAKQATKDHMDNEANPHKVTAKQVGLENVDNTSDEDKPVSKLQAEAIADAKKAGTNAQETADNALPKKGGEMSGNISMSGNLINGVGNPVEEADAVPKKFMEDYVASKHLPLTGTLVAANWEGETAPYVQTLAFEGISEEDRPHVSAVYSEDLETAIAEKEAWSMVSDGETGENTVKFTCFEDKPELDISIQIEVNR